MVLRAFVLGDLRCVVLLLIFLNGHHPVGTSASFTGEVYQSRAQKAWATWPISWGAKHKFVEIGFDDCL